MARLAVGRPGSASTLPAKGRRRPRTPEARSGRRPTPFRSGPTTVGLPFVPGTPRRPSECQLRTLLDVLHLRGALQAGSVIATMEYDLPSQLWPLRQAGGLNRPSPNMAINCRNRNVPSPPRPLEQPGARRNQTRDRYLLPRETGVCPLFPWTAEPMLSVEGEKATFSIPPRSATPMRDQWQAGRLPLLVVRAGWMDRQQQWATEHLRTGNPGRREKLGAESGRLRQGIPTAPQSCE
jgi:hypothetical protein